MLMLCPEAASPEKSLRFGLVADYRYARALKLIFFTKATSGRHLESANPLVYRDKLQSEKDWCRCGCRAEWSRRSARSKMGVTPLTIGTSLRM